MRRALRSPVLLILLVAPYFGEGLSGSTPPLDLLLPWNLAFQAALYGCGALLCREVAHRARLGLVGLLLLGAAYGVWEEALVDRYWFFPQFWHDSGVGDYAVVWHTNVLLAVHLTLFHAVVSTTASVLVVEWWRPAWRHRPWVGRRGLVLAALALAVTPVIYGEPDQRPPAPVLLAAVGLLVALVVAALRLGRPRPAVAPREPARGPARWLGLTAFACVVAHWVVVYGVPSTPLPWPAGLALALVPVVVGVLVVHTRATTGPLGLDGVHVVVGVLAFFVVLDAGIGLAGRYDLVVGAVLTAWMLRRLPRRAAGGPFGRTG